MSHRKFETVDPLPEFQRDLKKLLKRFRTLLEDLDVFIKTALPAFHFLKASNQEIFLISGLGISKPRIYKAKKFACRSLKGTGSRSGIRVIYAHFEEENRIELIEIYYKGDKKTESKDRIYQYYG